MGVMPVTDIFQSRMVSIFADMGPEKPIPYIDDIIHSKGTTFKLHLDILDKIFHRLGKAGMQVNADKSKFFSQGLKFLGFTLTPTGYHSLKKQVEAIMRILPPKNVKDVRHFSGIINFSKNHINGQAGIMQSITKLTKKGEPFVWGVEQQEAFNKIKVVISEAILLTYPDPLKRFHIFPDASSKHKMGAVLVQEDKTVSTFSRKFNEAQLKYTVTEQELLVILESCKHFNNIIHGCNITVHTDHKNLTYSPTQCTNARVERTIILLNEEFGVTIEHIKGKDNTGGDGLSRLPFSEAALETDTVFAIQDMDRDESHMFALNMRQILKEQLTDKKLQEKLKDKKKQDVFGKQQYDNIEVTTYKGKVWVPESLQPRLIDWFHKNLGHAGSTRTVNSISQTFGFPALKRKVEEIVRSCDTCQRHKQSNNKLYGKVPLVSVLRDKEPSESIDVDCIGPFKIQVEDTKKRGHILEIHCLTMVDSCTNWSEATPPLNHSAKHAAEKFDKAWLCSKPCPLQVVHNNGTEFISA
jgi:hypothetical protein